MIKIVLSIIVVVLLGYLGYGIEKYYKIRLKILNDYKNFINYVSRETDFYKSNLIELIDKYEYNSRHLKDLLVSIRDDTKIDNIFLNKSIISNINSFIRKLSIADYYFKNTIIKEANDIAEQMILIGNNDKTQKGELGRKIIILLGIGLIILII